MPTLHSTVCIACWLAVPVKGSTIPHSSRCTQRHSHHNHRRHSRQTRRRSRRSQTEIATFRALNSAHKLSTTKFRSAQILSARTSNLSQPQVQMPAWSQHQPARCCAWCWVIWTNSLAISRVQHHNTHNTNLIDGPSDDAVKRGRGFWLQACGRSPACFKVVSPPAQSLRLRC